MGEPPRALLRDQSDYRSEHVMVAVIGGDGQSRFRRVEEQLPFAAALPPPAARCTAARDEWKVLSGHCRRLTPSSTSQDPVEAEPIAPRPDSSTIRIVSTHDVCEGILEAPFPSLFLGFGRRPQFSSLVERLDELNKDEVRKVI